MRRVAWRACGLGLAMSVAALAQAQKSVALTEPETPLLPANFGDWQTASAAAGSGASFSLSSVNKAALEECGPQRSAVHDYAHAGRTIHIEAIEFGDRTGAESAFTLVAKPDMTPGKGLGDLDAVGDDAVLLRSGVSVVLISPAAAADLKSLAPLVDLLPKVFGNRNVAPLLPKLAPKDDMAPGSLRYALGPESYAAEGGVLPAQSLEWDKSAEALMASYNGKSGRETLTIASYPTPEIAGAVTRRVQGIAAGQGAAFANARIRREKLLLVMASGAWPADQAQKLVDGVHLTEQLAIDKGAPPPAFNTEVHTTVGLLVGILIFSGMVMVVAVVLAIFLGGGRALVRVLRGKPAAAEPEFLSLHLAQQNEPARFRPES
jgi:hypothetical protein